MAVDLQDFAKACEMSESDARPSGPADPTEKLDALAVMVPPSLKPGRFRAADKLLAMLKSISRSADYVE
ncbi:MAG: hypothetical protein EOR43_27500 [Mesorhizobium sp.]|nr:MAG: hypothetical protein EOQ89_30940 [Mesorhizobium sp.]RWK17690.1 MAG: hypothetical protein EOR43_27500 [Mesorhizobium sp.]RWK27595.1 MAG: hypothetical protein EOR44_26670 [Mesorhizobium sp.]RWM21403.1 MAG: hypothetical protein EOR74_29310 [Mesorhizobium sp.]